LQIERTALRSSESRNETYILYRAIANLESLVTLRIWDHGKRSALPQNQKVPAMTTIDPNLSYRLSRYCVLRPEGEGFVAESLVSGHRQALPNPTTIKLLLSLVLPVKLSSVLERVEPRHYDALLQFFERCVDEGLITAIGEDGTAVEEQSVGLRYWEAHDLAFHMHSRRGRNTCPVGATWHLASKIPIDPPYQPSSSKLATIQLKRPDLQQLLECDPSLSRVLESRRTRYGVAPVSLEALSELLFRSCRATDTLGTGDENLIRRVYPSGGSRHSLNVYVVAHRCAGLNTGGYRYDFMNHQLEYICESNASLDGLLRDAQAGTGGVLKDFPSVLLVFTSRIRRVTRKYQSLAYRVVLQEVGALYQTIYLIAETLKLRVSAIGTGNSDLFAKAFSTDFFSEPSVGEMILGGDPSEPELLKLHTNALLE